MVTRFFFISLQRPQTVLDKKSNAEQVLSTVGYIFSKYMHFGMRFLVIKISALLCNLNGVGIAVSVISY